MKKLLMLPALLLSTNFLADTYACTLSYSDYLAGRTKSYRQPVVADSLQEAKDLLRNQCVQDRGICFLS